MSYIGNEPLSVAFLTDTFSGNGSTVAFTMSVAPANTSSILVAITGVVQDPSTYSVSGTTLTFSAAPPTGTSNISVRYLGIPASGVTTTAYRTVTDITATNGQTTFTIPSYTVGYVDVFRNGVRLAAADFTATTGTTIVLVNPASAGDTITTVSFFVSSVLNAIQQYNGLSVNQVLTSPTANTLTSASGSSLQLQTNGGTTAVTLDTAQNMGLGVTPSPWISTYKALEFGSGSIVHPGSATNFQMAMNGYVNSGGSWTYKANGFSSLYAQNAGAHAWFNAPSGTAGNAISFTQAMTLDASGNLLVGQTTISGSTVGFSVMPNGLVRTALTGSTNATTTWDTYSTGAGAYRFYVGLGGQIYATNTTIAGISDQRLKENIRDLDDGLSTVMALQPRKFDWKEGKGADTKNVRGFIAQEFEQVFPDLIDEWKDPAPEGEEPYKSVRADLIPVLVKAIQEQQAIIAQLQADVAALKGQA